MADLILHLGAHRTGSTAVEKTLSRNAGVLAEEGIAPIGPGKLRPLEGFASAGSEGVTFEAREAFEALVEAQGQPRVVISEENMIGSMSTNIGAATLYGGLERRLHNYRRLFGQMPVRIGLGIRGYEDYWLSAYGYKITTRGSLPRLDFVALHLAASTRGWRDVLTDIRRVFPESKIVVWQHEDLRRHVVDAAALVVDLPRDKLRPIRRRVNARRIEMGHIPVIWEMRDADPDIRENEILARLEGLPQPAPFEPFSEADKAVMAARYAEDLDALAKGHAGVELVSLAEKRRQSA